MYISLTGELGLYSNIVLQCYSILKGACAISSNGVTFTFHLLFPLILEHNSCLRYRAMNVSPSVRSSCTTSSFIPDRPLCSTRCHLITRWHNDPEHTLHSFGRFVSLNETLWGGRGGASEGRLWLTDDIIDEEGRVQPGGCALEAKLL